MVDWRREETTFCGPKHTNRIVWKCDREQKTSREKSQNDNCIAMQLLLEWEKELTSDKENDIYDYSCECTCIGVGVRGEQNGIYDSKCRQTEEWSEDE